MKNKSQAQIITVVLMVLLVLAAIVIAWQVIVSTQEPHFKIYKEECVDESIDTGEQRVEFTINKTHKQGITKFEGDTTYLCRRLEGGYCTKFYENTILIPTKLYEQWDCLEYKVKVWWEGDIRKEQRKERICERNLSLDSIEIRGYNVEQKEQRDLPVYLEFKSVEYFYEDIYETKQTCSQVEVDEIETYDNKFEITRGENSNISMVRMTMYTCFEEVGNPIIACFENLEKISKGDLTIDWLERKAVCHECLVELETGEAINQDYKYCEGEIAGGYEKCYKYKFKDYIIKVK